MDLTTVAAVIGIATPLVVGLIWGIRLEGRISVQDERFKRHDDQFLSLDKIATLQNTDIINRLARIERKQDASSGVLQHPAAD
jgi:hypothetical protein